MPTPQTGSHTSSSLRSMVVLPDQNSKTTNSISNSTRQNRVSLTGTSRSKRLNPEAQHENQDTSAEKRGQHRRSRRELLESKVLFPDEFMKSMQRDCGPNGPMNYGEQLKPIAVVLRPNESLGQYEDNFRYWLDRRRVSLSKLRDDPDEERRYRQAFAYIRANSAALMSWDDVDGHHSVSRSRPRSRSRTRSQSRRSRTDKRSTSRDIANENEETNLKRSRIEYDCTRKSLKSKVLGSPNQQHDSSAMEAQSVLLQMKQLNHRFRDLERKVNRLSNQDQAETGTVSDVRDAQPPGNDSSADVFHAQPVEVLPTVKSEIDQPHNADIHVLVAEVLKKAAQVNADPAKKRLVKDYTRSSNQILQNERALEDSLAYVKLLQTDDKSQEELQNQIEKVTESLNSERQRRDTALAAVVAQEWRGRQKELEYLVGQVDLVDTPCATHEQLTIVYSQLGRNGEEVVNWQSKLKKGLSWNTAHGVSIYTNVQEWQELSSKLQAVLSERTALEDQRKFLCVELLRSNAAIFKLSMELIDEAHLWLV